MPIYNKLVRDLIPQVIEKTGKSFDTTILSEEEYHSELRKKLQEETDEYINAEDDQSAVEELADMLELMNVLAEQHGSSMEEVEKVRKEKAEKRGSFYDKVFLISVED
ncbi:MULTISPECIES: nucleoside triphosphate pyrophosphohydrolase [Pontibacillus]|uniref:Nucleoside triphosphate pyrophosphohydrolase n=1 Tax=Pontibacillus chungwhensis TaxID=265426 RepID=A0ABY8V2N1_9BACI|nr:MULTISPECIES: nucleoside triphosphate pyrophosphohydrolase [Pontibacillus]MCD5324449.1 nucleoside triphosphate pyrophosphohydrolase [Pontibacillus sp. HN14]WIF99256.1 nucleoside triphosphate pyrophosphohydrolase [Pontibacillus chungwhensis]